LEAFAKFGSDLDAVTLNVIEKEEETLKSWNKVWTILILLKIKLRLSMLVQKLLRNVPVNKVKNLREFFLITNKHRATLLMLWKQES
jgi:F-type H+-transporting ATPase subunit alpha